ncbi:hypothetical protein K3495_g15969 [Podosphaera aphanis]|nr:hypothetical protein K3495_g15969 [Podosphaera aphanis]
MNDAEDDAENETENEVAPTYELTVYNRHRLNDDKAKDAAVRELIQEQRSHHA